MADKQNIQTKQFDQDLNTDVRDYHGSNRSWTYARNCIPNSKTGDIGDLGNEPSTDFCIQAPYPIIGKVYLYAGNYVIFSTDDTGSEIGFFNSETCTYNTVVNDNCLNFNRANLITGVSKKNHDCTWHVYWSDGGRNPDRVLNIDDVPYLQNCTVVNGCLTCVPIQPLTLDCDKLRLASLMTEPCIEVKKGASGGSLLNGSYFAVVAYMVSGQRVTNYFTPSNLQPLFEHNNVAGSLDISLANLDQRFDEYELVLVSIVNQQTQAKRLGIYNTRQTNISVDIIDPKLVDVPLELIPLHNPVVEASDAMFEVNDYLIRTGPRSKFDFNYQPRANQIVVKWRSVEYPATYYRNGGNEAGYLRDENYALFIEWVYNDGSYSSSNHIPGRPAFPSDLTTTAGADAEIENSEGLIPYTWMVKNTATISAIYAPGSLLADDGIGVVLSEGLMGYHQSTELYPDDKPAVWGNLCGQPIRHHRFPEQSLHPTVQHYGTSSPNFTGMTIRIMGIVVENILPPVDNNGVLIPGIVGYRILRGSREGNKTIVAKGIINNMFEYDIEGGITSRKGLYPNYPYNDLNPDPFISKTETNFVSATCTPANLNPNDVYRQDAFTFHSPDTQFRNPFLSMKELKVYGEVEGSVEGQFVEPQDHPKHKLITDLSFYVGLIAGVGTAMLATNGQRTTTRLYPRKIDLGGILAGTTNGGIPFPGLGPAAEAGTTAGNVAADVITNSFQASGLQLTSTALAGLGTGPYYTAIEAAVTPAGFLPATEGYAVQVSQTDGDYNNIPAPLRFFPLTVIPTFLYYFSEGTDAVIRLIKAVIPYRQYALQYQSHCFYNGWKNPQAGNRRRLITDEIYLDNQLQDFTDNYRINNLYRGRAVALKTLSSLADSTGDTSRQTVGMRGIWDNPTTPFNTWASSHYVALKNRLRNQYGQIGSVQQVTTGCVNYVSISTPAQLFSSSTIFGGDTYVTRYTEKNTMFFFYDWMYREPDGFEYDYRLKKMVPHPAYWMDTKEVDVPEFLSSVVNAFQVTPNFGINWSSIVTPSHQRVFDRAGCSNLFAVKEAYMYLFNSGVRDFFVESEINTDLRDWEDEPSRRHYDPYRYTDVRELFNMSVIKSGNFFKYDYSLSAARAFTNFISWAQVQPINYDPEVYASCYVYNPNRLIYSLQQQFELVRDNWRVYLPNNYKDFKTRVIAIKPINKTGAIMFFDTDSPVQFNGVDTLNTDNGVKVTIGDGGLFNQALQNMMVADRPHEYGSCQNRESIINTPFGVFWMSQNQGKIFQLQNGVAEISMTDLKWWLALYLPYFLTRDFPDFELQDNPVIGIGCQAIYDNENGLVYFTKRDFKMKAINGVGLTYLGKDDFLVNGVLPIKLGDPTYFEDTSWTLSYDPKTKNWVSWHDWHPNGVIPGKGTFMSIKGNQVWVHNQAYQSYCKFYGVDYPFEIGFRVNTGQQTNTLRSIESQVEVYRYADNGYDRYLYLTDFFDELVVFNQEQVSGLLKLNLTPTNNPFAIVGYPKVNVADIDVLYSKVEGKYRVNQFFDITDDRGQFTNARRMIWLTDNNGYTRRLNPQNLNYQKNTLQLKKFRGYEVEVLFRKRASGDRKFLVILENVKQQLSVR